MNTQRGIDGGQSVIYTSRRFPKNLKLFAPVVLLLCLLIVVVWGKHAVLLTGCLVLVICAFRRRTVLRLDAEALSFDNGFVIATAPRQSISNASLRGFRLMGRALTVDGKFTVKLKYNNKIVSRTDLVVADEFDLSLEGVALAIRTWAKAGATSDTT